jgi:hypothetical protein
VRYWSNQLGYTRTPTQYMSVCSRCYGRAILGWFAGACVVLGDHVHGYHLECPVEGLDIHKCWVCHMPSWAKIQWPTPCEQQLGNLWQMQCLWFANPNSRLGPVGECSGLYGSVWFGDCSYPRAHLLPNGSDIWPSAAYVRTIML